MGIKTFIQYLGSIGFSLRNFLPALGAGVSRSMSGAVSLEERELSLNQQSDRFDSLGIWFNADLSIWNLAWIYSRKANFFLCRFEKDSILNRWVMPDGEKIRTQELLQNLTVLSDLLSQRSLLLYSRRTDPPGVQWITKLVPASSQFVIVFPSA